MKVTTTEETVKSKMYRKAVNHATPTTIENGRISVLGDLANGQWENTRLTCRRAIGLNLCYLLTHFRKFNMFRWTKSRDKEKEKDDKKKKDKKDRKDRKSTLEKESLTPDELKRLDEVRRSFTSTRSYHSKDQGDNSEKQSNGSDYSLSSHLDSSPSGSSISNLDPNKSGSPSRKPPPVPKKPTLLVKPNQTSGNIETTPSPQGSTYSMASLHLGNSSKAKCTISPTIPSTTWGARGYGMRWKSYASNLRLPPVTSLPAPPVRTLTIKRQPTGDFGFALRRAVVLERRSPDIESRQTVVFAEPSTVGTKNLTGLLPGDKLLQVNDTCVESKPREEIIQLICSSGDSVVLKVQTVPELRELTKRCNCDNQPTDTAEITEKNGALSPTSDSRFEPWPNRKKKWNVKTWLSKDMVWVVHKGDFLLLI
ncbi:unconventional myosin-XVIIIa [Caerostris extrusa]|uniref:Unconventional myosin-XVIIIa n=1 Tax=Caerostris extrusa TaxID=172846 RepID=A0AAV4Y8X0_CAEEX|nr:unconventional myosin-XVIIIa [Caerostris extrusa]